MKQKSKNMNIRDNHIEFILADTKEHGEEVTDDGITFLGALYTMKVKKPGDKRAKIVQYSATEKPMTGYRHIKLATKIVCYCGSIRVALEAFKKAEYESLMRGEIALLPCCMFVDIEREYGLTSEYKRKADEQHKRKIDICDEVFILNVGGYIGESTRNEIDYAEAIGKPVFYLEPLKE